LTIGLIQIYVSIPNYTEELDADFGEVKTADYTKKMKNEK
jgi:hypothetical protein